MYKILFILQLTFGFLLSSCANNSEQNTTADNSVTTMQEISDKEIANMELDTATFAGGCFWCTEASFERIKGVKKVVSGYSGGKEKNPTYSQVSSGMTGHAEAIQIYYDPEIISYDELLEIFFVAHDPTQLNRQGPDVGPQYRSAIFYHNEKQQKKAQDFINNQSGANIFEDKIVTELSPYTEFYIAEGYHQNYYEQNPDDRYIQNVSKPKVDKVEKEFKEKLKEEYK